MQTVLWAALSNTVFAAAVGLAAAVVYRFSRRPAVAHALWIIALIKLVTPPVYTLPVPQFRSHAGAREIPSGTTVPSAFVAGAGVSAVAKNELPVAEVLMIAWGVGSVVVGAAMVIRLRQFGRILRHARPADEDVARWTRGIGRRMGMRDVAAVCFLPGRVCPMLWATPGNARLLVPDALWESMTEPEREKLVAHELAHQWRGDHRVRWLEAIATVAQWWNPVLWMARRGLHEAEEACCDAWVTRTFPNERDGYAAALVSAIEFAATDRPPVLASGIGYFRSIRRRILMIQDGNISPRIGKIGAVGVVVAALVLPLAYGRGQEVKSGPATRPAASAPSAEDAKLNAATLVKLDRTLPAVQFDRVGFSDTIDFLRDVTGANIYVSWDRLKEIGIGRNKAVTLNLRDVKFGDALSAMLINVAGKPGLVRYAVVRGVIVILPAGDTAEPANLIAEGAKIEDSMRAQLDKMLPALSFRAVGFSDVVDFLQDVSSTKIVVRWDELKAVGIDRNKPVSLNVRNARFGDTMSALLVAVAGKPGVEPGVLRYTVEGGNIVIVVAGATTQPK